MDKFSQQLFSGAKNFGLELSEEQLNSFEKYYETLKNYNSHTNLISNDEKEEVYIKHFLDSLAFSLLQPSNKSCSIIDIGCGGGFPGVPLLIAYEKASLRAVDSVGKKIRFIDELSCALQLEKRLKTENKRIEDLPPGLREHFDYATARAVAPLGMLVEYCVPFLKVGGCLVAYKSKSASEEIEQAKNALKLLHSEIKEIKDYKINDESTRNLIVIQKMKKTDLKYPRKNGFVKKYPI